MIFILLPFILLFYIILSFSLSLYSMSFYTSLFSQSIPSITSFHSFFLLFPLSISFFHFLSSSCCLPSSHFILFLHSHCPFFTSFLLFILFYPVLSLHSYLPFTISSLEYFHSSFPFSQCSFLLSFSSPFIEFYFLRILPILSFYPFSFLSLFIPSCHSLSHFISHISFPSIVPNLLFFH